MANAVHIVDVTIVVSSAYILSGGWGDARWTCVDEASGCMKGDEERQRQKGEITALPYVEPF